jgi:serine/threonine-protein kinase
VVKQLKPASNDPSLLTTARRLFKTEAESLTKLGKHDQIPQILAYFEENQEFYLVQEFIEGHPLSHELTPGQRLSEPQAIALLQGLLPVVEFIHQHNVIHRDIKPDNIIRRKQDGKLVLIDFGAVKEVQAIALTVQNHASATVAIGTPGYMPTEQGRGKPKPSSDIYALGMIAIQAITGMYPDNLEEDTQTGEILWQHHASVSPGLAAVLTQMVRYHFKERYQSATEVLQALQQLANPSYTPTVQATVAATTVVYELTLAWVEAGRVRTEILSDIQPSKNPGSIRIGRDPALCDIVLLDATVSGLHVEIFFNRQQQCFKARSLRPSNPPLIDGQPLLAGEMILSQGSSVRLGQVELRVSAIALKQYPAGYTPSPYITPPNTPAQPVGPTLQPQPVPNPWPNPSPEPLPTQPVQPIPSRPTPAPTSTSFNRLPVMVGVSLATVISLVSGLAFKQLQAASNKVFNPQPTPSVSKPQEICSAVVNGRIRSKPASFEQNIVTSASGEQLPVTGKQTQGGWIEIKLDNGNLAWAHRKVISNNSEMDSCLQAKGITVQNADDIPAPAPVARPKDKNSEQTQDKNLDVTPNKNSAPTQNKNSTPTQNKNSDSTQNKNSAPTQNKNSDSSQTSAGSNDTPTCREIWAPGCTSTDGYPDPDKARKSTSEAEQQREAEVQQVQERKAAEAKRKLEIAVERRKAQAEALERGYKPVGRDQCGARLWDEATQTCTAE